MLQVPLGAGLALAHQYKGEGGVAVAMYGDGAANQVSVCVSSHAAGPGVAGVWRCMPLPFGATLRRGAGSVPQGKVWEGQAEDGRGQV